jgi:hypothetical protein
VANADLTWALGQFRNEPRSRLRNYALARDYYEGRHRMAFATGQFQTTFGELFQAVSDNLCPAVVDSLVDRLEIIGFSSSSSSGPSSDPRAGEQAPPAEEDPVARAAWDFWRRNRMDVRAPEVHREALLTGDGFAIVWPDPNDANRAHVWPQYAHQMAVEYDADVAGQISRAAKLWRDQASKRLRLNLYFADRIEKYESRAEFQTLQPAKDTPPGSLVVDAWNNPGRDLRLVDRVDNVYGRVPVFHFPNKRIFTYGAGGELGVVYPLQDALNKFTCDMLVAGEFAAFPQRWVTGLEVGDIDEEGRPKRPPFNYGVDKLLYTESADSAFGNFQAADLKQFLEVLENFRAEIARVSGTPLHYLFITRGDFPSGEAMKSAEARFTKKLRDRQTWFGNVWEDLVAFALQIEGQELGESPLDAIWTNASPRSEKEIAETLLMKQKLGVTQRQIFKEMGYSDREIETMLAEQPEPEPAPPDPPAPVDVLPTATETETV